MTEYNFDQHYDRRNSDSAKWKLFDDDVLPMWVADMDFPSPPPIIEALQQRVAHGFFGYGNAAAELSEVIVERMAGRYDWQFEQDAVVFLPNLFNGLVVSALATGAPGTGMVVQTPVYGPFIATADRADRTLRVNELVPRADGPLLHYEIDFDDFEAKAAEANLFLLCNPHNPVGRVYTRAEQERLAEICARHDVFICSDEIHSDLIYSGNAHIPIATLGPEVAARTITLHSTSKTFNTPGLGLGYAIIPNPEVRAGFKRALERMSLHMSVLSFHALIAAYRECDDWVGELLCYLEGNRNFMVDYVTEHMPGVRLTKPEGTYLGWLDLRETGILREGETYPPGDIRSLINPFFLDEARVALNEGAWFGQGGRGFARLNFGCQRDLLAEGLDRMAGALNRVRA
jgi:cystathionine beta-lyase